MALLRAPSAAELAELEQLFADSQATYTLDSAAAAQVLGADSPADISPNGLGTENQNLPAYVVLNSSRFISGGESLWGSGFIPSTNAGVLLQASGNPVLNLRRPAGVSELVERRGLDSLSRLNGLHRLAVRDQRDLGVTTDMRVE